MAPKSLKIGVPGSTSRSTFNFPLNFQGFPLNFQLPAQLSRGAFRGARPVVAAGAVDPAAPLPEEGLSAAVRKLRKKFPARGHLFGLSEVIPVANG